MSLLREAGKSSPSIPRYLTGAYSDHAVLQTGAKMPKTGYQGTEIAHQAFNIQ